MITLEDLTRCRGVSEKLPSTNRCMLHAMLANLKAGLVHGHIIRDHAAEFLRDAVTSISGDLGARPVDEYHIDSVYVHMCEALMRNCDRRQLVRRTIPTDLGTWKTVTVQPYNALRYLLDPQQIPHVWYDEPSAIRAERLCDALETLAKRKTNGRLGLALLWLTPFRGEVATLVDGSRPLYATPSSSPRPRRAPRARTERFSPKNIARQELATRLQELLGLAHWKSNTHTIGILVEPSINTLIATYRAAAPTVFDATTHPRFRHWPMIASHYGVSAGRTYDLNRDRRRRAKEGEYGTDEIVTTPLPLSEISEALYLGLASSNASDRSAGTSGAASQSDIEYVADIAGRVSLPTLLTWLGKEASV